MTLTKEELIAYPLARGPRPYLSEGQEAELEALIELANRRKVPISVEDLCLVAAVYKKNNQAIFTRVRGSNASNQAQVVDPLSSGWFDGYKKRNPNVKVYVPHKAEMAKATSATTSIVSAFFSEVEGLLEEFPLLKEAARVVNWDESSVRHTLKKKSLGRVKGSKTKTTSAKESTQPYRKFPRTGTHLLLFL